MRVGGGRRGALLKVDSDQGKQPQDLLDIAPNVFGVYDIMDFLERTVRVVLQTAYVR